MKNEFNENFNNFLSNNNLFGDKVEDAGYALAQRVYEALSIRIEQLVSTQNYESEEVLIEELNMLLSFSRGEIGCVLESEEVEL